MDRECLEEISFTVHVFREGDRFAQKMFHDGARHASAVGGRAELNLACVISVPRRHSRI